jgi:hypothetical protein
LYLAQVTSFSNFYSGDPYIGTREKELKTKNEEIIKLQQEVKKLRKEVASLEG